jgi:hypothetical protein
LISLIIIIFGISQIVRFLTNYPESTQGETNV